MLYRGAASSAAINDQYMVLTIKSDNGIDDHAVAISPLAGVDATFVARVGCTEADWWVVFAKSKAEAVDLGAHSFRFTATDGGPDRYRGMRDKVVTLLERERCLQHQHAVPQRLSSE
mgnify:CR=1 FL=1